MDQWSRAVISENGSYLYKSSVGTGVLYISNSDSSDGLSTVAKILIAVGAVIGGILIIVIVVVCVVDSSTTSKKILVA